MTTQSRQTTMALSTLLLLTAGAIVQAFFTEPLSSMSHHRDGLKAHSELKAAWRP